MRSPSRQKHPGLLFLVVSSPTDTIVSKQEVRRSPPTLLLGGTIMKRRPMSKRSSRRLFKRKTGVQKMNSMNPKGMRGGIRL